MNLQPVIVNMLPKKLIGLHLQMSLQANQTGPLWGQFMRRRHEIKNTTSPLLYSIQFYDTNYFMEFSPAKSFEKWAAIEVNESNEIPEGMHTVDLTGGLYAVFDYRGSSTDPAIFQYIYGTWIPSSEYILDHRPHFEVLGDKYKNNDPNSEEQIWIPIKNKIASH